jgi:hypothetical protein
MIEYQYPPASDIDLSGVEYKSIPSGAHIVTTDVIYFKTDVGYGVCAFERKVLSEDDAERDKERGARIRAVGLVSSSYTGLHRHLPFLSAATAEFASNVGDHEKLKEYYLAQAFLSMPNVGLVESVGLRELQV